MAKTVDEYVRKLQGWQAEAAEKLRALIRRHAPHATEAIKWGQPVYDAGGPVGYWRAHAQHLTFGFWRGKELRDPEGKLESSGSMMAHVKLRGPHEVDDALLGPYLRQAVALNEKKGSPASTRKAPAKKKAAKNKKPARPKAKPRTRR